MATATSPYEPDSHEATYWQARHRLAAAARALNEKLVSSDIDPEFATALTEKIDALTAELSQAKQLNGLVDMAKHGEFSTLAKMTNGSSPKTDFITGMTVLA